MEFKEFFVCLVAAALCGFGGAGAIFFACALEASSGGKTKERGLKLVGALFIIAAFAMIIGLSVYYFIS